MHAFQADLNFIFFATLTEIKSSRGKKLGIRDYTEALILKTNPRGLKIKRKKRERKRKIEGYNGWSIDEESLMYRMERNASEANKERKKKREPVRYLVSLEK